MRFYKRHLGDYAKDTAHLSQGQIGAYDLLMDWYYSNERPLPLDQADAYRIARAHSSAEKRDAAKVLAEFFVRTDDGYTHKRIEREISEASEKSTKAAQSACARWSNADADSMRTHAKRNATRAGARLQDSKDPKTKALSVKGSEVGVGDLARENANGRSISEKEIQETAAARWTQVLAQAKSVGRYGTPRFPDEITTAALRNTIGGWTQTCALNESDVEFKGVKFKAEYARMMRSEVTT